MKTYAFEVGALYRIKNEHFFSVMFFTTSNNRIHAINLRNCSNYKLDSLLYLGCASTREVLNMEGLNSESACYKFLTNGSIVYSFVTAWLDPVDHKCIEKVG